jgi:bifunctional non-homologous end joining protein LigD
MGLADYRRKRNFDKTAEPRGAGAARAARRRAPRFVVQKHDASHLHYDFRLEAGGVLKSWAVPKGPSLDPRERRLAVEVEDHPLEYGDFEGTIPAGEYGGGTVLLWDRGRWIPHGDPAAGLRAGKLEFELEGEKLRGAWKLVRLRPRESEDKPAWLLIKAKDAEARASGAPDLLEERPESVATGRDLPEIAGATGRGRRVWRSGRAAARRSARATTPPRAESASAAPIEAPRAASAPGAQLATLVGAPPAGEGWIHELKLDGYRVLSSVGAPRGRRRGAARAARLVSRNGLDWTERFEGLAAALASLPVRSALLDGEVVALTDDGKTSFEALQRALRERAELTYFLFDLLHLDGRDLAGEPLVERKRRLRELLERVDDPRLRYTDHVEGPGDEIFARACRLGAEGMISKRADAPYRPGRGRDWLKVKCVQRQEVVIGGFTEPEGSRTGFGALLVGVHEDGELRYAGKVGTGFDAAALGDLRRRLARLERRAPPFVDPPRGAEARSAHWVAPRLVAEVRFLEWTAAGALRHPVYEGLREDKDPREVRRESPVAAAATPKRTGRARPARGKKPGRGRSPASSGAPSPGVAGAPVEVAGVALSHPERVLYPEQGVTKADLARYFESVADWILPHVAGRPLTLVRCPQGRARTCFYQKHAREGLPRAVRSIELRESGGKDEPYLYVDDLEGLVGLVQIGVLELHLWGARVDAVERPDRLVFDLDPDPSIGFAELADAARLVRETLAGVGLESWLKTTGGKGLHVVVPIARRSSWDDAKAFARALAEAVARRQPERFLTKASKAARKGRIFLDWLRNARGATAVAPYSTRARPGAPVATPLDWRELEAGDPRAAWTLATVPDRLRGLGPDRDPWRGMASARQAPSRAALRSLAAS